MPTLKLREGALAPYKDAKPTEITLQSWRDGVRPEGGRFALVVPNDVDIREIAPSLASFSVVILDFPKFRDGRAYSQARILREQLGFKGEIRARGDVLRDQAFFMARAGFDAFELEESRVEGFTEALRTFSQVYQPAADDAAPAWRLRAARAVAA